jgi:cytochrome c biogenesis protein ResB
VKVDDKVYQVSLRPKRVYKTYTFHLKKLDVVKWPNSEKPKDYSSYIRLVDPPQHQDRDVRIFMNNPLSYEGETFYQSSVGQEPGGPPATTLQVVRNPGWIMPYLSCLMVAGGMLVHFGQNLYRFIERRAL